jgi:TM2 domain-containing membrane protein YozV
MNDRVGLSADTQAIMAFESSKKSTGVAYVLWLFTGGIGGHRFYLGRTGSAVGQLVLSVMGWMLLLAAGFGIVFLIPLGIWLLIDLFLIPGMAEGHNQNLMRRLNGSVARNQPSAVEELAKFADLHKSGAISDEEYAAQKQRLLGAAVG